MLIDTHCHLTSNRLRDETAALLDRARAAGVGAFVTIATHPEDFADAAAVADAHPDVWFTAGLHPHDAARWNDATRDALFAALDHPRCLALGEIGLDYHYDFAPRALQQDVLRAQLAIAADRGLPVVFHCREAHDDLLALLDDVAPRPFHALMHCFTEGPDTAARCLERGLTIGLGGAVTFRNSTAIQEAARALPADRFVLETDAPYMAPLPHRGKRCEPAHVATTAAFVAELRAVDLATLADATTATARRFFRHDFAPTPRPTAS